ncbi:hypothetical protein Cgig2_022339 [Carnegiea gigantea]|uniref:ATP-dependent Clp protease proteolytic subunit n=1 Tax=Carnegiea gigantea TaxID=171969 RepID=A0A9Q1QI77_9CARY|nr:hypothetical protein Cgig2_022339 [Carnegiea gigantea]
MEMSSCLAFTGPSSSTPVTFFNHGSTHFKPHSPSVPLTNPCGSWNQTRRRSLQVKALEGSVVRQTLSSNWDLSAAVKPSPLFPRFDDVDTTSMLLRQRIVFLGSQVDDTTADFVISQLLLLDAEDSKKDIKLFIYSPGGSITAGMGIYDAMKLCKADVSTICLGLAASMGTFLLAAGTKGKRYCMPNAQVMIHQPYGMGGGTVTEFCIRLREMGYHKVKLNKMYSRITGKPEQQIEIDTERDNFMSAWEAKEYGLVDAVIDDGKPGLVAPVGDTSPPPKSKTWVLWQVLEDPKFKKDLPSEHKLFRKACAGGQNDHSSRGTEQEEQTPASV